MVKDTDKELTLLQMAIEYVGEFEDDLYDGQGSYFDAMLGTVTKGKWEEDFFVVGSN